MIVGAQEGYRLWAATYDEKPNPLLALEERLLTPLVGDVSGKRIVDVGCGTGRWLGRLRECGAASVVGIDASPEMLARAGAKGPGGALVCARGDRLPLRTGAADVILCSFLLGYVPDLTGFAREIARVAAPGALVFLSDFHPEASARGWRRSFHHQGENFEVQNFARPISEIQTVFEAAGFDCAEVRETRFEEPERGVFAAAGKPELFAAAVAAGPAVYLLRFQRKPGRVALSQEPDCAIRLTGARVAVDARTAVAADWEIRGGRVHQWKNGGIKSAGTPALDLTGCMVLPGLINAHDHLEFNLFPRLGQGPYRNFLEWAQAIYWPEEWPVCQYTAIPKRVRLWWGALKNLLSGVTTVCHHNPYDADVFTDFPVRVVNRYGWAHSIALGGDIETKYRRTPVDAPFIIHLAEGTDEESGSEIFQLDRLRSLGSNTVVVHGVALNERGHRLLQERGAALVWCPSSNLFTLGKTIATATVCSYERAALGTDSALSGAGDLLDELRTAVELGLTPDRAFDMVTSAACDILQLRSGEGALRDGGIADLLIVRDGGASPAEALCSLQRSDIEAVVVGGRPRMMSHDFASRWPAALPTMQEITIDGVRRLVDAPVAELVRTAQEHVGADLRLAGKPVSA